MDLQKIAERMWFETPVGRRPWYSVWSGKIRCHKCPGIRTTSGECPACRTVLPEPEEQVFRDKSGNEFTVPSAAYMGAEGSIEDVIYLSMLEREWFRPISEEDQFLFLSGDKRPSPRAALVMLFWTYFETRIERLFKETLRNLAELERERLLQKNASIGARLKSFYKARFGTTYLEDLVALGHGEVANLLEDVWQRRNRFAHGHPEAIDDQLVERVVAHLKDEHDGWVAVFNRRVAEAVR